ncbi:cardiolipin synthase [Sporosarcina sp. P21c]|uniref:cardiolipin synthase n=1 Tax=Sporosarcina TaxID=1569 RepID=UPI000A161920|nr:MULTISPECIES: cardiolipin synthase [Sporosarcina]ARJ38697.1 cardiolipin synthase [Sporosarcina ureae]PIC68467.1 cardiolipin synthase [Sporosarcina sp. P16a]PIC84293.1 cardiolipin synthase [Sporosarcina sp. P1]PIC88994.1 cardiolipin synthase [Sporosarcina sp. P21c]PIC92238.1 cardiolipin synthase [Sporosarcina sp. P25]
MTQVISLIITSTLIINIFLAIALIFLERRDPTSTWAWLLVLFFIPILGFIIYLLLGRQLRQKHLFRWEGRSKIGIEKLINYQLEAIENETFEFLKTDTEEYDDMIYLHLRNNHSVLTQDNDVQVYTDGRDKFDALIEDLENARDHIHIQYYIFRLDGIGKQIEEILINKAKSGVKIRMLFDDIGSRGLHVKNFHELIESGGEVAAFFPALLPLINPRLNYRNHRKIVIIDGRIGYIGGFNVGDEYLGLSKKFGYWRDTHLRIEGSAVHPLQTRFILDWNQASPKTNIQYNERFFPAIPRKGDVGLQIVSSGPDSEWEDIKDGYLKMIFLAKDYIYIQTPYFIPDTSMLDALRIACLSGVDVRIMIPNKPDHMFVYWATYSNVGILLKAGARIYIYENGFIHAKQIVVDDQVSSVGTANIDVRSFRLNFEVNAFIYDREKSHELAEIFEEDIQNSTELTLDAYLERERLIKVKESISRLLSPIL